MLKVGQIGIMCRDLERSVKFYGEVLGLPEVSRFSIGGRRIVALRSGAVDLELIEVGPGQEPLRVEGRSGLNHFAFYTRDLGPMVKELKGKGVKFTEEPRKVNENITVAFFEDPDGVRLELVQFR